MAENTEIENNYYDSDLNAVCKNFREEILEMLKVRTQDSNDTNKFKNNNWSIHNKSEINLQSIDCNKLTIGSQHIISRYTLTDIDKQQDIISNIHNLGITNVKEIIWDQGRPFIFLNYDSYNMAEKILSVLENSRQSAIEDNNNFFQNYVFIILYPKIIVPKKSYRKLSCFEKLLIFFNLKQDFSTNIKESLLTSEEQLVFNW